MAGEYNEYWGNYQNAQWFGGAGWLPPGFDMSQIMQQLQDISFQDFSVPELAPVDLSQIYIPPANVTYLPTYEVTAPPPPPAWTPSYVPPPPQTIDPFISLPSQQLINFVAAPAYTPPEPPPYEPPPPRIPIAPDLTPPIQTITVTAPSPWTPPAYVPQTPYIPIGPIYIPSVYIAPYIPLIETITVTAPTSPPPPPTIQPITIQPASYVPPSIIPTITVNGVRAPSLSLKNSIKQIERFSPKAYWDGNGWAIGYGHHGPDVNKDTVWTEQQASLAFDNDIANVTTAINNLVNVPLNQNQFDALTDLIFNVGINSFANSRLLGYLNAGDYNSAATEFTIGWNTVGGVFNQNLEDRRQAEFTMFTGGLATLPEILPNDWRPSDLPLEVDNSLIPEINITPISFNPDDLETITVTGNQPTYRPINDPWIPSYVPTTPDAIIPNIQTIDLVPATVSISPPDNPPSPPPQKPPKTPNAPDLTGGGHTYPTPTNIFPIIDLTRDPRFQPPAVVHTRPDQPLLPVVEIPPRVPVSPTEHPPVISPPRPQNPTDTGTRTNLPRSPITQNPRQNLPTDQGGVFLPPSTVTDDNGVYNPGYQYGGYYRYPGNQYPPQQPQQTNNSKILTYGALGLIAIVALSNARKSA